MQINRDSITAGLEELIEKIFLLPEIKYAKIRDVIIHRKNNRAEILESIDKSYHDCYSDVDLTIMVKISPKDPVTTLEYMKRIDRFGIRLKNCLGIAFVEESRMYRIILQNGLRYDLGFDFDYDEEATFIILSKEEKEYSNPNWPIEKVNQFWFVQIQALAKLYRKDFLIGDHLANMNLNETLVQQMVLRDLKYGTNHHRYGYEEDLEYIMNKNKSPIHTKNERFNLIADKIHCAALTYDELTKAFYPEFRTRSTYFFDIWNSYEQARRCREGIVV